MTVDPSKFTDGFEIYPDLRLIEELQEWVLGEDCAHYQEVHQVPPCYGLVIPICNKAGYVIEDIEADCPRAKHPITNQAGKAIDIAANRLGINPYLSAWLFGGQFCDLPQREITHTQTRIALEMLWTFPQMERCGSLYFDLLGHDDPDAIMCFLRAKKVFAFIDTTTGQRSVSYRTQYYKAYGNS